jgi:signal peptidase I
MTSQDTAAAPAKKPSFGREVAETLKTVVGGLAIALVLRVLVFQPYTIPSSSMEPGLVTGDYVVISKWSYGWSRASIPFNLQIFPWINRGGSHGERLGGHPPERGDVIVFRRQTDPSEAVIKRLIGLPGDRVQVVAGQVRLNGVAIPRAAVGEARDHDDPDRVVPRVVETAPNGKRYLTYGGAAEGEADNTQVYVVPEATYFFMGDNRGNSLDSRGPKEIGMGFVPAENLVGRAEAIGWSWKQGASIFKPWTWLDLDWRRLFQRIV